MKLGFKFVSGMHKELIRGGLPFSLAYLALDYIFVSYIK